MALGRSGSRSSSITVARPPSRGRWSSPACSWSHAVRPRPLMPTVGSWKQDGAAYYGNDDGDTASFLGSAVNMDRFIDAVTATADAVGCELKRTKKIDISFDEKERLVRRALTPDRRGRGPVGGRAAADRGRVQRHRRRCRRQPPDLAAAAQRPRRRRLHRTTGERDRADHDQNAAARPGGSPPSTRSRSPPGSRPARYCDWSPTRHCQHDQVRRHHGGRRGRDVRRRQARGVPGQPVDRGPDRGHRRRQPHRA